MKFVLLLLLGLSLCKDTCDTDNKEKLKERGISKTKQQELLEIHNDHRNNVAVGKIKNWQNKLQTSSNMYYIKWDNQLSQYAQECADRCPATFKTDCSFPPHYGHTTFLGDVENGGADWTVKKVFKNWISSQDQARQIELSSIQFFGCGRSQILRKNNSSDEVVVCVYNRKAALSGDVYKAGVPGQECQHGLKKGFLGLCKHSKTDMSVISFQHQKHNEVSKNHHREDKHHLHHNHHHANDQFHKKKD